MTRARMALVGLLALTLVAPATAKTGHLKLKYPAAGQASLAQITFKGKPTKPRLKGKLPSDVALVAGSRKLKKGRWVQSIVVFRRKATARAHAAGVLLVAGPSSIDDQYPKGSALRTAINQSFLPGGTPLPSQACTKQAFLPGAYRDRLAADLHLGESPGTALVSLLGAGCGKGDASATQTFLCGAGLLGCNSSGGGGGNTPGGGGGNAPPAFTLTGGATFTPGAGPTDIAVGNLDGNSFPDVVTSGSGGLTFFLGGTGGTLGSPGSVSTGAQQDFVGIADVNGDGKQDILAVNSSPGAVQAFLGDGAGAFTPAPVFSFGSGAPLRGLAIGNFNGDSRADVAVGQNDGQAAILLGQASGGFAGSDFPAGLGGANYSLAIADFNADGSPDLVVTGVGGGPHVVVLINHNDGTFPPATSASLLGAPTNLAVGDFSGDGKADVAVLEGPGNVIQLFPGAGDGTFGAPTNLSFTGGVRVAAGDVNGDGVQDVIGLNQGAGSVSVFLGQQGAGLAGYQNPISALVVNNPVGLALGDFNGDTKNDMAVFNFAPAGQVFLSGP